MCSSRSGVCWEECVQRLILNLEPQRGALSP